MLSRHYLRSKVLQTIYASQANPSDVVALEKSFSHNIKRLNDLGTTQLAALTHFIEVAGVMIDEAQHKFLPTEAEKNPNKRMLDNLFLSKLADNYDLRREIDAAKVNFGGVEFDEVFRNAYTSFVKLPDYKEYLQRDPYFLTDQTFALKLFKFLVNYEPLRDRLFPQSLLWEDDFDQIAQYNFMMMKAFSDDFNESSTIPLMCDTRHEKDNEGYEFARQLLLTTLRHTGEVEQLIRKNLRGWEFERVACIDIIILNMAVAEFTTCPSIPERVTIDEYIELAKEFSTDRSRLFVNGILDRFVVELRSQGRIQKTGRGLLYPEMMDDNEEDEK